MNMSDTLSSQEIRQRFLSFFEKRGHAILPSAPLVPENDPSVLFNTAGMQPLVPYLLGQEHPKGKRLANIQKCVRTVDIDEVGDKTHDTFFEMMGNWSLGDYFKKEAIEWSYEFLTSKEEGLGLDPQRLYVTVFEGDNNAPKDEESYNIWKEIFDRESVTGERIYYLGAKSNWWEVGQNGPCGPDTEMFYDLTGKLNQGLTKEEYLAADDRQEVVEVWNDVFMEYEKKDGVVIGKLKNSNVDTGSGLERVVMAVQGKDNIFETDLFVPIMTKINELSRVNDLKAKRIVADHIRTAVFLIADGVLPSNTSQGYILRRLIRRAVLSADKLNINLEKTGGLDFLANTVIEKYKDIYSNVFDQKENILAEIWKEQERFRSILKKGPGVLEKGLKEFEKIEWMGVPTENLPSGTNKTIAVGGRAGKVLPGKVVFDLYQTYGFPVELTEEIAKDMGAIISIDDFKYRLEEHKEISRAGAEQKFKGGLADNSEETIKYHTATHLLNQALTDVLGNHVEQKGSNITPERLRFDFSHPEKLTEEQISQVEAIVNQKIAEALPVEVITLPKEEALKIGARHVFLDKYGNEVTVYYIGNSLEAAYSKEFCGGPHVKNTSELGQFKITKEEAVSAGVRRIKAILE